MSIELEEDNEMKEEEEDIFYCLICNEEDTLYPDNQISEHRKLAQKIREVENKVGHTRTILVGDLNVNPFEEIMILADGFHAVSNRHIARKGKRKM